MPNTCAVQELSNTPRQIARLYYQTGHEISDVMSPDYFAPAARSLRSGDVIEVWARRNSTPVFEELVVGIAPAADGGPPAVTVKLLSDFRIRPPGTPSGARRGGRSSKRK